MRFSRNDRTVEVIKMFIIWLMNKGKKSFERKSSIYIRRCARLPIHSASQTQGRTTQSVNFATVVRIPLRAASPKYQLDLEIAKKSNFFKLAQNEALWALVTKILF